MDSGSDPEQGVHKGRWSWGAIGKHNLGSLQGFLRACLSLWAEPFPLLKGQSWGPFSP